MNKLFAPANTTTPPIAAADDAYDRLNVLGWRGGLAAVVAGLAASFFLFGYALIYWRNADMDFMVVYNALVLNDGKPQRFFDHTAYITILSVKFWFRLLHALGLLDAWSLSAIPPASDVAGFDAAMTSAVRAGRLLALLTATGCVLIFAGLIRRVVRDWRVAMLATFAFAFSGGIAVHSRILRSELVAACPVIFALLILIVVGRRASPARPLGHGGRGGIVRARPREQGAGDPADRRAADADPAVRKRRPAPAWRSGASRRRRWLATLRRGHRRHCRGMGRHGRSSPPALTAPCSKPRSFTRCCWAASASIRPRC